MSADKHSKSAGQDHAGWASMGRREERRKDDRLDKPNGIAIGSGQIYVADQGNHHVQILNADLNYKRTCSLPDRDKRIVICPEKRCHKQCW